MASGHSKRGGGDRVLEGRHLIGLFLGVVLLCCVFFTLGYVMGKTQYGNTPVEAATLDKSVAPSEAAASRSATAPAAQPPSSPEWDFYSNKKSADIPLKPSSAASSHATASASVPARVNASPSSVAPASRPASVVQPPARFRPPRMSRNAIVLQVGALRSEGDALALADALQQKGFPAFVLAPTSDNFYRVQVGPFPNQAVGDKAKQSLQREGFKAIFRR
ncbi:MAG TPA: SPOR domain-containing protein [Candidatus Acidoferrales bacterium]|nr:SPOR domain-containing protein [Candidatus Acidoferrales bacterium]